MRVSDPQIVLGRVFEMSGAIAAVSTRLDTVIAPFGDALARLDAIPGANQRTAQVLIAELGVDMCVFSTAGHPASWPGLCPGNNDSACTHRSARTRNGNRWLRSTLIEAALAAGTQPATGTFAARHRRVMQHRGHKKAAAAAHSMLVTAYHLLARNTTYHDPGADSYGRRDPRLVQPHHSAHEPCRGVRWSWRTVGEGSRESREADRARPRSRAVTRWSRPPHSRGCAHRGLPEAPPRPSRSRR